MPVSLVPQWYVASRYTILNYKTRADSSAALCTTCGTSRLTTTCEMAEGFQMRWAYRRDMSNQTYFAGENPGDFKKHMDTALIGLIWWFGGKQGTW